MSEKLSSHSGSEDVKTPWDELTESEIREHGITVNASINNGRDKSWSEKDWLESHSGVSVDTGNQGSWSEKDWLELQAAMPSDEDVEAEHQRRTGASIEAVQNMSDDAARYPWSNKEQIGAVLDVLEQEPDSIRAVIERRARSTLGDFAEGGRSFTFNPDKVFSDLAFIDTAIERGNVDVGEIRIDPEPLMHTTPKMMGVGQMLDRMSKELAGKTSMIKDPNNPGQTIDAKEYISEIRAKIKDPVEDTPSEQPVAEQPTTEQSVAEQPKEQSPEEKAHQERIDAAKEDVMARYEKEQAKYDLAHQINLARQQLAEAKKELSSHPAPKEPSGLFKRFAKKDLGSDEYQAAAQKVQGLTEQLAALEEQGKEIGIL